MPKSNLKGVNAQSIQTNLNQNPAKAACTVQESTQGKSKEWRKLKSKRKYLQAIDEALKRRAQMDAVQTSIQDAAQTSTQDAAQSSTQGAAQTSQQGAAQTSMQGAAQTSMQGAAQTSMQGAAQTSMQGAAQTAAPAAAQTSASPAAEVAAQPIQTGPNVYILPPNYEKPEPKTYTNQQKKKWLKFQKKIEQRKINKALKQAARSGETAQPETVPKEMVLPETSQDGSPGIIGDTSESSTSVSTESNQGSTAPIIQKPSITLTTKKSLQQDMAIQRLNSMKPGENVPGTSASVPLEAPSSAARLLGSTIPTLENRTVESKPRSDAGSFFKNVPESQPQTPRPLFNSERIQVYAGTQASVGERIGRNPPRGPIAVAPYRYPTGIPRSFLMQQEKSLEAGGSPITIDSPIWPNNPMTNTAFRNTMMLCQQPPDNNMNPATSPILVQAESPVDIDIDIQQPYSPSDIYSELGHNPEQPEAEAESSDQNQSGHKRLSAFQRLGPVSQPKKSKLTINLKKDQPVREVVNETEDDPNKYTPVHLRTDIMTSTDETVVKYLPAWPWRKNIAIRRSATARNSRSVMILEQEKMEEAYEKENIYIQISVKGYPSTWTKERVLDAVLDSVKGYSLIPCFTEFTQHECKFLVLRSRSALIVLHKTGFYIHKNGVELTITISVPILPEKLDFIPRIILRKRVIMGFMDKKVNLSAFTLQDDISHFIYFPLDRVTNQRDVIQLQTSIDWNRLVELDLSHNRLTTIVGFDLINVTPRLKHLNLSHNCLEKITVLLSDRLLPLKTIHLEGNPLCHDYTDPEHYVKVIRMMFPAVVEIDGVPIHRKGELPVFKQNYCPEEAQEVAEKFLEIFFPLLDSGPDDRSLIQGMYEDDATLTITYCYKLRYGELYRNFRNLFLYARFLDEGETDSVVGAMAITKLINRWPHTEHDPFTFAVDVLSHTETTTILRVSGVLKLTAETLAEDEHLLSFTRTVVLYSEDGAEYKIHNEMVYWSEPTAAAARSAFRVNTISQKNLHLKIEATTDEDLRDKFLKFFMKLTTMDKKMSERCLEINDWNLKLGLEHFTKLLKTKNLDSLTQEVEAVS